MIIITLNKKTTIPLLALVSYFLILTIRITLNIGNQEPSYEITKEYPIVLFIIISIPAILGFILGYNTKLSHIE